MKYYLVALFDKESCSDMEDMQKTICKKYKIYKNMPVSHVTLEIIGDPDFQKLNKIISDILKPYKKFKVKISGGVYFDSDCKSMALKVENKGYIIRLARQINETLKLHGFDVRQNSENYDLHISLANVNYAIKELNSKEYIADSEHTKREEIYKMAKVDRIEIWKAIHNKKETIIKSFSLREF